MYISVLTILGWMAAAAPLPPNESATLTFEHDVRPIFKAYCFECHGESETPKAKLDLRLRRFIVDGGRSGPGLAPGQPEDSELLIRVLDGDMPPGEAKLSAAEVDTIRRWIASGAKTARPEPKSLPPGMLLTDEDREWWAFQPIARPTLPAGVPTDRVRTPIDHWLHRDLAAEGLTFNPDADRRTLIRRVTFDLTGLPPTPAEINAFLNDKSIDAYETLVDRLETVPKGHAAVGRLYRNFRFPLGGRARRAIRWMPLSLTIAALVSANRS